MTKRRTMTAVTAAILVALAGCGGGDEGSDERARTVAAPTTSASPEAAGGGSGTLTEAQLQAALLTVADLPTGYTAAAEDGEDDEDDGATVGEDAECSERFEALDAAEDAPAKAEADFEGGFGVFLQQQLASFEDEDELQDRMDTVVDVLSDCPSFTTTDDEGVTTDVTIGQLSFPKLGDDTVALAFTGNSEELDLRFNLVVVRLGRNLMSVTQGGLTADPAALEQATRTGLEKLTAATE